MGYCQRHKQEKPERHRKKGKTKIRVKERFDGQEQMTVDWDIGY